MTASPHDPDSPTRHCFTVDVEEYFQVTAFEGVVAREEWGRYPRRLGAPVDRLLATLGAAGVRGTFFVLGWVAHHEPQVVRTIAAAGHEIASHGYWHRRLTTLTPDEFRDDLRQSKRALEDLIGAAVIGFRAPSFSIVPGREWAFDVLLEEGFRYDSSLFPIRRRGGYGYPGAPRTPHLITRAGATLAEFPLAVTDVLGVPVPAAGGGYLRHLPFALIRRAFRESSARGHTATFYVHPWELDPEQPRLPVGAFAHFRHYRGLGRTLPRLERLLAEFPFATIESMLDGLLPVANIARASSAP